MIPRGIPGDLQRSVAYANNAYRHRRRLQDNKSTQFLKLRIQIVIRPAVDQNKELKIVAVLERNPVP
jgi:hypothetical protein